MFEKLLKKYSRIVFFDTETTGFEPENDDQIIELAALCVDRSGKEAVMDEFIRLEIKKELPAKITELTGITELDLNLNGITETEALEKFIALAFPDIEDLIDKLKDETLLVAHNAQFDLLFLAYALIRQKEQGNGTEWGKVNWLAEFNGADYLDTLTVYRDRHRFPHKLQNAIDQYGLGAKVQNTHRAIDDCRALFEVAKAMEEERDDLDQYVNIFGYPQKYGITGKKFKKVAYLEQGYSNFSGRTLPEQLGRGSRA